jgi:hypothetical protein
MFGIGGDGSLIFGYFPYISHCIAFPSIHMIPGLGHEKWGSMHVGTAEQLRGVKDKMCNCILAIQ